MANENTNNSEIKAFFKEHGSKVAVAVAIVVAIVVGVVQYIEFRKGASAQQAELLGPGMAYMHNLDKDSALVEFESKMNEGKLAGLALAKAALFAGNIKYEKGEYDAAAQLFQKSLDNAGSVALVRSAAMHGLASVKMEKEDFSAAAGLLEKYIGEFAKRTGDKEDRYQRDEPVDEVPAVADAMWKLTLVYQQLGATDKAKKTAERLLEVYGDNQTMADNARKFLATL
ncbi:MAG: tetratricopeptide repeat protein [Fibrobacter sp.]|nr:tetratricopeptide repeat protein [Fibrobacter sp.]